ncbi:putative alpha-trehalose glucohydrolase [Lyophyllum shimeji]|uniref:Trehalase n=1 Tax=Lyophyllum shimeji TaxID=47721 RepID=A0A9P3UMD7_LYOSH|nr:putative alpha-trehalose glucohydrolase [Lyophyllum shimeji]
MFTALAALACIAHGGLVQAQTSVSTVTVPTATPSPSAAPSDPLPSQAALPPRQTWCPSDIFCAGALLQTVNLAHLYPDDKTFIDKPTSKSAQEVLADFKNISSSTTTGQIVNFVENDFKGEGQELEALELTSFKSDPAFLKNVSQPIVKAFAQTVHGYWNQLIRGTNASRLCPGNTGCESSLIPLNHTFVVPGGRFREQYYWDSFWIVEGLIESELFDVANATLQNFMDELDRVGFIPNGGRIYYLDRSQPPLFIQMLARYVTASGDQSILRRALPLAEKELKWWDDNRSVQVTSPSTNATHKMYHYSVNNSAPRPESYRTDYLTANEPNNLNETQRSALYAELASGAESGWDYTVRWFAQTDDGSNNGLRSLNVRNTIAVDLNSILYKNHVLLASLYASDDPAAASAHTTAAAALLAGILDLFWDSTKLAFYDFNLATKARNTVFSAANFYPLWSGIIPNEILSGQDKAFGYFSSLNLVLNRYNGTFPTTFIDSGLQWDAPNTWPPHQYIVLQALRALPSNITSGPLPTPSNGQNTFNLIPAGQLGLTESQLPGQPVHSGSKPANATASGPGADINRANGTVVNGGAAVDGEGWGKALERQLANRYITSAFCSWRATGGSIDGVLPKLPADQLNVTQSVNNTGNMFEKFSNLDVDSAGRGGEYTVQAGFGWTNGVVLWVASLYGGVLAEPQCPSILAQQTGGKNAAAGLAWNGSPAALIVVGVMSVVVHLLL